MGNVTLCIFYSNKKSSWGNSNPSLSPKTQRDHREACLGKKQKKKGAEEKRALRVLPPTIPLAEKDPHARGQAALRAHPWVNDSNSGSHCDTPAAGQARFSSLIRRGGGGEPESLRKDIAFLCSTQPWQGLGPFQTFERDAASACITKLKQAQSLAGVGPHFWPLLCTSPTPIQRSPITGR